MATFLKVLIGYILGVFSMVMMVAVGIIHG